ncbi:MAG: hypothetical protein HFH85_07045 [Lachnospiraceae bacterium]|jgi:hypothetical protein|nr:hypothetical protein [Lachnospiraceae bacterium]
MKIRVCKINRMTNPLGFTKEPKLEDFESCVVYSDLERTGDMQTGDSRVNRLFRNARKKLERMIKNGRKNKIKQAQ